VLESGVAVVLLGGLRLQGGDGIEGIVRINHQTGVVLRRCPCHSSCHLHLGFLISQSITPSADYSRNSAAIAIAAAFQESGDALPNPVTMRQVPLNPAGSVWF